MRNGLSLGLGIAVVAAVPAMASEEGGGAQALLTPHIGSATLRTRAQMADMAVENVLAALKGERMPSCANPEVYELRSFYSIGYDNQGG